MRTDARALALIAAGVLVLTGCGGPPPNSEPASNVPLSSGPCPEDAQRSNVILVVGTHANMPAPVLLNSESSTASSPVLGCAMEHIIRTGGSLRTISVDGAPAAPTLTTFSTPEAAGVNPENSRNMEGLAAKRRGELLQLSPTAQTAGSDLYAALDLALRTASSDPENSLVIVLDNGLTDTGVIDFATPGSSVAPVDETLTYVRQTDQTLPASDGVMIYASGLAETAPPQEPLPIDQAENVRSTWQRLLEETGATVTVELAPWANARPPATELPTEVVEPVDHTRVIERDGTAVLDLTPEVLGFAPDAAELNPSGDLQAALQRMVDEARDRPDTVLFVIGRTDSHPTTTRWKNNEELSLARADAVANLLNGLGADPARIETVGQGYRGCPDDGGPENVQPGPAQQNRRVIVGLRVEDDTLPVDLFCGP